MSYRAIILLAFSMSMDAFAVSVGRVPPLAARALVRRCELASCSGGQAEAITPLIGWAAAPARHPTFRPSIIGSPFALLAGFVGLKYAARRRKGRRG